MTALALDPTVWLALSLGLVALSTTAVLVVALPAVVELGRAARSAEKLLDTLNRELPPVLEAMRTTGEELSELTDGVGEGVERAGQLVQQVDQGVTFVRQQAGQVKQTSGSVLAGVKAAWRVLKTSPASRPAPTDGPQSMMSPEPSKPQSSKLQSSGPQPPNPKTKLEIPGPEISEPKPTLEASEAEAHLPPSGAASAKPMPQGNPIDQPVSE